MQGRGKNFVQSPSFLLSFFSQFKIVVKWCKVNNEHSADVSHSTIIGFCQIKFKTLLLYLWTYALLHPCRLTEFIYGFMVCKTTGSISRSFLLEKNCTQKNVLYLEIFALLQSFLFACFANISGKNNRFNILLIYLLEKIFDNLFSQILYALWYVNCTRSKKKKNLFWRDSKHSSQNARTKVRLLYIFPTVEGSKMIICLEQDVAWWVESHSSSLYQDNRHTNMKQDLGRKCSAWQGFC